VQDACLLSSTLTYSQEPQQSKGPTPARAVFPLESPLNTEDPDRLKPREDSTGAHSLQLWMTALGLLMQFKPARSRSMPACKCSDGRRDRSRAGDYAHDAFHARAARAQSLRARVK
jgi:hypothetical protein